MPEIEPIKEQIKRVIQDCVENPRCNDDMMKKMLRCASDPMCAEILIETRAKEQVVIENLKLMSKPPDVPFDVMYSRLTDEEKKVNALSAAKAMEYAKAETYHALNGPASEKTIAERLAICGSCEFRKIEYKGEVDADNFGWCSKCGCGSNPRALLKNKARMAKVSCPLTPPLWDVTVGVGGSVASVIDAAGGVAQSIKHLLTGNNDKPSG